MIESTIIQDVQEFFQKWEKVNNPFYPNECRWDRIKIHEFLSDYRKQFERSDNVSDYAVTPSATPKLPEIRKGVVVREYSQCGKYVLLKKIDTFEKLQKHFDKSASVYCKDRPLPVAFLQNWSYRLLKTYMEKGWIFSYAKKQQTQPAPRRRQK